MGLTIHYSLTTEVADLDAIRSLVGDMRDIARQLPFQEVSDILEYRDQECRTGKLEDEYRWLKIQAGRWPPMATRCARAVCGAACRLARCCRRPPARCGGRPPASS